MSRLITRHGARLMPAAALSLLLVLSPMVGIAHAQTGGTTGANTTIDDDDDDFDWGWLGLIGLLGLAGLAGRNRRDTHVRTDRADRM